MKCPNCGKYNMPIEENVFRNLASYDKTSALARAGCCGTGVIISHSHTYKAYPDYTGSAEDDWGNDLKPRTARSE
jgi:hypothetical protein